jgi:hypothetical protein
MPKFIENFNKFTFAVLTCYVITVPVSSSALAMGENPVFQKIINAITVSTTVLLLISVFFQWRHDKATIKTDPFLAIAALVYLIVCFASAIFAESNLDHCLTRVFTLFCFINNAFWPHIIFPKSKQLNFLTGAVIVSSLFLSVLYSYMAVINNFSVDRYLYSDVGRVFNLPTELGLAFDPNIMLFGFMYGIICLLSLYSSEKLPKFAVSKLVLLGLVIVMIGLLGIMFSRTTAVALGVTVIVYWLRRYYRDYRLWIVMAIIMFFVVISASEISEFVGKSEIYNNLNEGREFSNDDRLYRLNAAIFTWLSDVKSIIIGRGYGIEIILDVDPHNIYLTHLHSSGVIGFMAFAAFIIAMKLYGKDLAQRQQQVLDLSFIYIAIGAATYWHNKSMWVIFLLCLMRTQVYRTQANLPDYDFQENPVTQLGTQLTTFLTGWLSPDPAKRQKNRKLQKAHKKQRAAEKRKRNVPDWAAKAAEKKSDLFEESLPSKIRTGFSKLYQNSAKPSSTTFSKKTRQMLDKKNPEK